MKVATTEKPSKLEHTVIDRQDSFTLETKAYYTDIETYDWVDVCDHFRGLESIFHRNRERAMKRLLRKHAAPGPCLDVGTGTGLLLRHLPPASVGLDINPRNMDKARRYAGIERARGEYVCVLDADLQHPPQEVMTLLRQAQRTGAGMVIATRYGAGGHLGGLGGWARKAVSRLCKWLAQALLLDQARNVSDPLSGFFLLRRSLVHGAGLRPVGYKIGLEILSRVRPSKIVEVPYEFAPRQAGQSKASLRQGVTFLVHLLRLLREVPQAGRAWKFTFVGALGMLVNLTLLLLLSATAGLPLSLAWFLAAEATISHNFIWHQTFTWRDRRGAGAGAWLRRAAAFHLSVAGTVAINGALFGLLSITGAPLILAGAVGIAGAAGFNFIAGDVWVFRPFRAGKEPLGT